MHSDPQAPAELAGKTMYERDPASQALGMALAAPKRRIVNIVGNDGVKPIAIELTPAAVSDRSYRAERRARSASPARTC